MNIKCRKAYYFTNRSNYDLRVGSFKLIILVGFFRAVCSFLKYLGFPCLLLGHALVLVPLNELFSGDNVEC